MAPGFPYRILILTGVLSMRSPGVFLISITPLSRLLPILTIRLPVLVSLSFTFLISLGGTFATPKANLIILGALVDVASLIRTELARTSRRIRLTHGVPSSGWRLQMMGTRHLEPLQGMGFCGVAGSASKGGAGGGAGGGGGGAGQTPTMHSRVRLYITVASLKPSLTRMV